MSVTTSQYIAAREDRDLLERLIATAEQAGIRDPRSAVVSALPQLVLHPLQDGQTVASVHAYAADVRAQHLADSRALPPGLNPGAVTDDHLRAAIQAVLGPVE